MARNNRRRFLQYASIAPLAAALPAYANTNNFPVKPIKIVVGFSAGGTTDALPRLFATQMSRILGQTIVVENKPGAAGNIATAQVARSSPDGYTLLASSIGQITVSPHTMSMSVDPQKDLEHISMFGEGDQFLTINKQVPATNIQEFIALAKSKPHTMFYGDSGAGGNMHLYLEYFRMLAKLDIDAVHFKGGSQIMPDLISNRVQLSLLSNIVMNSHAKDGSLRPILLYGKKRDPNYPDVPTVREAGLPDLETASNWFGLHAPKGTPRNITDKIYGALLEALKTKEVREGLVTLGITAGGDTPEAFSQRIAKESETFRKVAELTKIVPGSTT
ncbi:putative Bug-like extracytoplasmic solute binding receptor, TTT family [Advenella mimigardefordensis DPN7]|uniref:Putative Bug-like extracytoplasmic solute binding receptor, TTT family n=2 Tax=Advenella mimigardefordensis TaxID=302406 RepID=W0PA20_ADVMD|nr:putative Bug-like extracytoplasmic solute binding receptor, TTT family [Advenella mimigardefordensis DPN7]